MMLDSFRNGNVEWTRFEADQCALETLLYCSKRGSLSIEKNSRLWHTKHIDPLVGIVSIKAKQGTIQFRDYDIADILTCWVRKKKLLIYIINEIFFSLFWQDVLFLKVARDIKFVELKLIDLFR